MVEFDGLKIQRKLTCKLSRLMTEQEKAAMATVSLSSGLATMEVGSNLNVGTAWNRKDNVIHCPL